MVTSRNSITGGRAAGRVAAGRGRSRAAGPPRRVRFSVSGIAIVGRQRIDRGGLGDLGVRAATCLAADPRYRRGMPQIAQHTLENGLPLYRVGIEGTRATTLLIAFDAGARTERPEENGMAHFLEHLVFKGGEKYPTYRDVNQAAEGIGAVLNAYTSHDLVAFHITARAERALEAADLLTDFVGRPKIDAEELDRERGVVVQEIARANDQPSVMAEHLIDETAFGNHPLGRPVLGPAEHVRDTFTREGIVAFRERRWSPSRGGAFLVGNLDGLPANGAVEDLFTRFPELPAPQAYEPAPPARPRTLVKERDSNQSHLRMSYRPEIEISDPKQRAALTIYSTLLGGSM